MSIEKKNQSNYKVRGILEYIIASLVLYTIMVVMYQLNKLDIRYSNYFIGGDPIFEHIMMKAAIGSDWSNIFLFHNIKLAFPGHFNLYDFPAADSFNFF